MPNSIIQIIRKNNQLVEVAGAPVGIFITVEALQIAFPAASHPGKVGMVGSTTPYEQYISNGESWASIAGGGSASVINNLTSTSTTSALSAAQGKILKDTADTLAATMVSKADAGTVSAHNTSTSNPHAVTKAQIGLGNVDNTSDSAKPVSLAQAAALANKQDVLVSAVNIKSVNGQSLLGEGDIPASSLGLGANLGWIATPTGAVISSDTGSDATLSLADVTNAGLMSPAQVSKLAGITVGATANATDSQLRDRSTHTGTQLSSTISDFNTAADARVATSVVNSLTSTSTTSPLSAAQGKILKDAADTLSSVVSNKADLVGGKLSVSQVPDLALQQYLGSVPNQAAMLLLVGQFGDWCSRSDLGTDWRIIGDSSQLTGWLQTTYPSAPVQSVNSKTGVVILTPEDIGAATSVQGGKADTASQPAAVTAEINAAIVAHGSAIDPHPTYLAQLASTAGASMIGVQDIAGDWGGANQEAVNEEIGFLLIRSGAPVNALRAFSTAEQAAIIAKTSTSSHQTQLADLLGNNPAVYFPFGRYNGDASITITNRLHITGHRFAELKFTDGAYTAIRFTSSSAGLSTVENLWIVGTNTTTPTITLLKFDTQAAYNVIRHCTLAFAAKLIAMDGVYVTKLIGNSMSNADVYWSWDDTTAGAADLYSAGNTYGTSLIGTQAMVQVAAPGVRIVGDCWETQQHTKQALELLTGTVYADVDARFENSGGVTVGTSVEAWLRLRAKDSYTTSTNRFLRVDASGSAYVSHSQFLLPSLDATKVAISASGACYVSGSDLKNWGTGALFASIGSLSSSTVRGCTTGVQFNSGSTAVLGNDLVWSGNTTNIVNNSNGSAAAPGSFTASLTGCTTTPTSFCRFEVSNGVVTLSIPAVTGTSNSTSATLIGLPACIQPSTLMTGSVILTMDNGIRSVEECNISGGTLTLHKGGSSTGFSASGTKGVSDDCTITYRLRNV